MTCSLANVRILGSKAYICPGLIQIIHEVIKPSAGDVCQLTTTSAPFAHLADVASPAPQKVEVDDLDATEQKVLAAGLKTFSHGSYDPGRRFYFLDPDGIEYEVVSYR